MPKISRIRKQMQRSLEKYQRRSYHTDNAMLGDGNGLVRVPGQKHDCYVRVNGLVMKLRNTKTAFVNNLPVIVGFESSQPNLLQVLGVRDRDGVDLQTNYGVAEHHELHEYDNPNGGSDVVYINIRQIMACRVSSAGDAFNIYVHRGMGLINGVWKRLESADKIDLSSYVPGTGACYVLIYINLQDGSIGKLAGTTATSNQVLDYSYIPNVPSDAHPLAAVRLYDTQTIISERFGYDGEIVDLRMSAMRNFGNNVTLYHAGTVKSYPATGAGLTAAAADAVANDIITVPPGVYAVSGLTIGTDVTVAGAGQPATLISGDVILSSSVILSNLIIYKTGSSSSAITTITLPTGSGNIAFYNVTARATNTGTGDARAIYDQSNANTLYLLNGIVEAIASSGGTAYAISRPNNHAVRSYSTSIIGAISGDMDYFYYHGSIIDNDSMKFGDGTNHTEIAANGTITLNGTAKVDHTHHTALIGETIESPSAHLTRSNGGTSVLYDASATLLDYVAMADYVPYGWDGGGVIPRVHWRQASATVPNMLLQYRWQKPGQAQVTTWTNIGVPTQLHTYSSGTLNQCARFNGINPPSGAQPGDIIELRVVRDTNNDSGLFSGIDPLAASIELVTLEIIVSLSGIGE